MFFPINKERFMLSFFLCLVNIDIEKRAAIYSSISIANKNVSISSPIIGIEEKNPVVSSSKTSKERINLTV